MKTQRSLRLDVVISDEDSHSARRYGSCWSSENALSVTELTLQWWGSRRLLSCPGQACIISPSRKIAFAPRFHGQNYYYLLSLLIRMG